MLKKTDKFSISKVQAEPQVLNNVLAAFHVHL